MLEVIKRWLLVLPVIFGTAAIAQDGVLEFALEDSILTIGKKEGPLPKYTTVAMRMPIKLSEAPASVSVVTAQVIEQQNNVVLSDALRNVSGVNIQSENGVLDYFYVRGFNSIDNGLLTMNGAPEPEATFYNLYNIDRVEILKGPSAFMYGGNPLAFTVNLNRKVPLHRDFANVQIGYGQFATTRATVDAGVVNAGQSLAGRLNAVYQQSDGYRNGRESTVYGVNPSFNWQTNPRGHLTVDLEYLQNDYTPDAGIPIYTDFFTGAAPTIELSDRETIYQRDSDQSEQTVVRAKAEYKHQLTDRLQLRNRAYLTDLDWQSGGTLINGAFPAGGPLPNLVSLTASQLDDRQRLLGNQLELVLSQPIGNFSHTLLTGVEFSRLTDKFDLVFRDGGQVSLADPATAIVPASGDLQFADDADATSDIYSAYLFDRFYFSPQVQLFAGARFDAIRYSDVRSSGNSERDYDKVSPMGGLIFAPTETVSLYASASQAFAPPSSLTAGDPEAEESQQLEAGVKLSSRDDRYNGSVAIYTLEKKNIGIPDQTGMSRQSGSQRSRGVEIEAGVSPVDGITLLAAYAFTDAEFTEFTELVPTQVGFDFFDRTGNMPAFAPEHMVNFWASKSFDAGFGLGLGGRYLSEQFIAAENVFAIDSAFLLDAAIWYNLGRATIQFNAKNLTDTETEMRGFGNTSVIPAAPLAVFGSVAFSL